MLGAALGTLLDGIHAYGDVLAYADPTFGRWAWFVPLEFGFLGLGAGLVVPSLERTVAPGVPLRWSLTRRAVETLLFCGLYVATVIGNGEQTALLVLGLGALAGLRLVSSSAPGDWAYVCAAAVLGPGAEAALSALGPFEYLDPDIAGIPFWLPALWANAGFLIRRLVQPLVLPTTELTTRTRRARRTAAGRS